MTTQTLQSKIEKLSRLADVARNNNANERHAARQAVARLQAKLAELQGVTAPKTTTNTSEQDRLTRAHTAFRTWSEFCVAMDAGYVPTLRPASNDITTQRQVVRLVYHVRRAGYTVYTGR